MSMVVDEQRDHRPQELKVKGEGRGREKAEEVFSVLLERNRKETSQKVAFPKSQAFSCATTDDLQPVKSDGFSPPARINFVAS